MPSDNPVAKRNALVIPAGLVLFYCVLAILYAELIRSDNTLCHDGGKILIRDVCYNVWKLVLPLVLISLGVLLAGLLGFRTRRTGVTAELYHGSGSHFVMAMLASFVAVPLLGLIIQLFRENSLQTTFVIDAYGVQFGHIFLLAIATFVGATGFLPFLALYLHQDRRRRRFLEVAELPTSETVRRQTESPADKETDMWLPLEEEVWSEDQWDGEGPAPALGSTNAPLPPASTDENDAFNDGVLLAGALDPTPAPSQDATLGTSPALKSAPDAETAVDLLPETETPPRPASYYDYPDLSRPLGDLPGVDRAAAELLARAGIRTTARLRYEDEHAVCHAASVPLDRVRLWKNEAELLCVPGIGPAYAQALAQAGVHGVDDLRDTEAETIHARLADKESPITVKRIQAWQENAKGLRRVRQAIPHE